MGMYDDQVPSVAQTLEISLQKGQFEETHEFHAKLRDQFKQPLPAGYVKLLEYNTKTQLYKVQIHWDEWCKEIGKAIGEMVLAVERDAAKQLYEREDRYPVYLILAVGGGKLKVSLPDVTVGVEAVQLRSPGKDWELFQLADIRAWQNATKNQDADAYRAYLNGNTLKQFAPDIQSRLEKIGATEQANQPSKSLVPPKQLSREISFERGEFDTVEEFHAKLRQKLKQPVLAGKARLVKYDVDKKNYALSIQWENWSKKIGSELGEMVLEIDRDTAKNLPRDEDYYVALSLYVGYGKMKIHYSEVTMGVNFVTLWSQEGSGWNLMQIKDLNAWESALNKNTIGSYESYLSGNTLKDFIKTSNDRLNILLEKDRKQKKKEQLEKDYEELLGEKKVNMRGLVLNLLFIPAFFSTVFMWAIGGLPIDFVFMPFVLPFTLGILTIPAFHFHDHDNLVNSVFFFWLCILVLLYLALVLSVLITYNNSSNAAILGISLGIFACFLFWRGIFCRWMKRYLIHVPEFKSPLAKIFRCSKK